MKTKQFLGIAVSLLLFVGCQSTSRSHRHGEMDGQQKDELRQISGEWDRLFNASEAAKLASLYADDAISMPPNNPTVNGRKALQADFESFFAGNSARHETMVDKIFLDGDLTIEAAHYRLTYKPRAGGVEVRESGRHTECRRKIGGKWLIVLEIWNSDVPSQK
jgi:ketosteroid isomerase-like protein